MKAAVCAGDQVRASAALLGLVDDPAPEVVLLEASDEGGVEAALAHPPAVPRVVVASERTARLLRAAGVDRIVPSWEPHVLGPALAAVRAVPAVAPTGSVVVTSLRGGVGRTLLAANLARRCAKRRRVWAIDATGSGALAWWLQAHAPPWSALEPLRSELTAEHLGVVAAEPVPQLRVLGGAGDAPSTELLRVVLERASTPGELVVIDGPSLLASHALRRAAQRVLVLSYADPASLALLEGVDLAGAWLIASQAASLGAYPVFRTLPRDEGAIGDAMRRRDTVGGPLGRAYDELAELLELDAG